MKNATHMAATTYTAQPPYLSPAVTATAGSTLGDDVSVATGRRLLVGSAVIGRCAKARRRALNSETPFAFNDAVGAAVGGAVVGNAEGGAVGNAEGGPVGGEVDRAVGGSVAADVCGTLGLPVCSALDGGVAASTERSVATEPPATVGSPPSGSAAAAACCSAANGFGEPPSASPTVLADGRACTRTDT